MGIFKNKNDILPEDLIRIGFHHHTVGSYDENGNLVTKSMGYHKTVELPNCKYGMRVKIDFQYYPKDHNGVHCIYFDKLSESPNGKLVAFPDIDDAVHFEPKNLFFLECGINDIIEKCKKI